MSTQFLKIGATLATMFASDGDVRPITSHRLDALPDKGAYECKLKKVEGVEHEADKGFLGLQTDPLKLSVDSSVINDPLQDIKKQLFKLGKRKATELAIEKANEFVEKAFLPDEVAYVGPKIKWIYQKASEGIATFRSTFRIPLSHGKFLSMLQDQEFQAAMVFADTMFLRYYNEVVRLHKALEWLTDESRKYIPKNKKLAAEIKTILQRDNTEIQVWKERTEISRQLLRFSHMAKEMQIFYDALAMRQKSEIDRLYAESFTVTWHNRMIKMQNAVFNYLKQKQGFGYDEQVAMWMVSTVGSLFNYGYKWLYPDYTPRKQDYLKDPVARYQKYMKEYEQARSVVMDKENVPLIEVRRFEKELEKLGEEIEQKQREFEDGKLTLTRAQGKAERLEKKIPKEGAEQIKKAKRAADKQKAVVKKLEKQQAKLDSEIKDAEATLLERKKNPALDIEAALDQIILAEQFDYLKAGIRYYIDLQDKRFQWSALQKKVEDFHVIYRQLVDVREKLFLHGWKRRMDYVEDPKDSIAEEVSKCFVFTDGLAKVIDVLIKTLLGEVKTLTCQEKGWMERVTDTAKRKVVRFAISGSFYDQLPKMDAFIVEAQKHLAAAKELLPGEK
ncbi:MAG: hypothetical protein ACPGXY_02930 [Alphaproteobacteria bacterium]